MDKPKPKKYEAQFRRAVTEMLIHLSFSHGNLLQPAAFSTEQATDEQQVVYGEFDIDLSVSADGLSDEHKSFKISLMVDIDSGCFSKLWSRTSGQAI